MNFGTPVKEHMKILTICSFIYTFQKGKDKVKTIIHLMSFLERIKSRKQSLTKYNFKLSKRQEGLLPLSFRFLYFFKRKLGSYHFSATEKYYKQIIVSSRIYWAIWDKNESKSNPFQMDSPIKEK